MENQGDTEIIGQVGDTDEKAEEPIVSTKSPEHALLKKISKDNPEEDQMMAEIRKVEKMAKEEVETITCDPFRVRLSFSLVEKLKMTLFGVFLVPIRFISAFIALNLAWAISCIGLVGLDNTHPVSGWRKKLQWVTCALGRVCCMCIGFQVSRTGTQVCPSHSLKSLVSRLFVSRSRNLKPRCLLLLPILLSLTQWQSSGPGCLSS